MEFETAIPPKMQPTHDYLLKMGNMLTERSGGRVFYGLRALGIVSAASKARVEKRFIISFKERTRLGHRDFVTQAPIPPAVLDGICSMEDLYPDPIEDL